MQVSNSLQRDLNYVPSDPPIGLDPLLADWLRREFFSVYLSHQSLFLMNPQHEEPTILKIGTIVYADGINWDPGSGEGPYCYTSAGWKRMFT